MQPGPRCKLQLHLTSEHCCRWLEKGGEERGNHHLQKLPVPIMLLFGACSGLVAQTATYPFDVVRRQMQVPGANCLDLLPCCLPACMMTWVVSVQAPRLVQGESSGRASHCTCRQPALDVSERPQVQGLKQMEGGQKQEGQQIRSTLQGLRLIIQQQGLRALFAGLSLNYIKVVPSTAIGFTIYDALKQYLGLPQHL